jgi:hypothetical protein
VLMGCIRDSILSHSKFVASGYSYYETLGRTMAISTTVIFRSIWLILFDAQVSTLMTMEMIICGGLCRQCFISVMEETSSIKRILYHVRQF